MTEEENTRGIYISNREIYDEIKKLGTRMTRVEITVFGVLGGLVIAVARALGVDIG